MIKKDLSLPECDPYLPQPLTYLQNEKIWGCFALNPQADGKVQKLPINPHTGLLSKINDPTTWGSFHEAN